MADKLDLYKKHKDQYAASKKPKMVNIPTGKYLTVIGKGEPGGDIFTSRIEALYGAAYTIKFARKATGRDYKVCPLEGSWWSGRNNADFVSKPKSQWSWKLMIRTPDFVNEKDLAIAIATLVDKGQGPDVKRVNIEKLAEGRCVQMLHVGPYSECGQTIEAMQSFAEQEGTKFEGLHHEIYLSDPRRVPPERLRTILRHPVGRA